MARPSVVTIGVFDGVHRGHQALIGHSVAIAQDLDLESVVVTFDPNPLELLRPQSAPTRLCSVSRRTELIGELGVAKTTVLAFDQELASESAAQFIDTTLLEQLDARHVVIGEGFRFGHRAQGDAQTLRDAGLTVDEFALVGDGDTVSSTRIRAAIAEGDVRAATEMLGRLPEVEGVVVAGEQRGRALGYPTANLAHHRLAAVPADGVYAGTAVVEGRSHPAAISIGTNPTFRGRTRTVEAYLLDVEMELYGSALRLAFVERLRPTLDFAAVSDLVEQMHADVQATKKILG